MKSYLKAWFPILGSGSQGILYLDGFAGPGIYSDGEEGSPIIALRTAINHVFISRFKKIFFWFIEKDMARAKNLQEVLKEKFQNIPNNVEYFVKGAEFAPTLETTIDSLEKKGAKLLPTFAFIDPFGFAGYPMNLISKIMCNKKCEVLITFMAGFINRFTIEDREKALTSLFGSTKWNEINKLNEEEDRCAFLIDLYVSQLKKIGSTKYVRPFEMRDKNDKIIYYLVFGTNNWKGLKVMKDAMYSIDRTGNYRFSDRINPGQSLLIDFSDELIWIPQSAKLVFDEFKGQRKNIIEIEKFVYLKTQYVFRKEILKYLEKSEPSKINNVIGRSRIFSYPDGCTISFSS